MVDTDTWFLLIQYKRAGRTAVTTFEDGTVAARAYGEAERKYADRIATKDVDVLLVGAESLDVVKKMYSSYFSNEKTRAAKMRKLLASLPPLPAH